MSMGTILRKVLTDSVTVAINAQKKLLHIRLILNVWLISCVRRLDF